MPVEGGNSGLSCSWVWLKQFPAPSSLLVNSYACLVIVITGSTILGGRGQKGGLTVVSASPSPLGYGVPLQATAGVTPQMFVNDGIGWQLSSGCVTAIGDAYDILSEVSHWFLHCDIGLLHRVWEKAGELCLSPLPHPQGMELWHVDPCEGNGESGLKFPLGWWWSGLTDPVPLSVQLEEGDTRLDFHFCSFFRSCQCYGLRPR